jgi:predicted permease
MGMDALVPAVAQCFSVILLGFIAGKWGLISGGDSKGLNTFIGTFSLPALVFLSMAQLDLRSEPTPVQEPNLRQLNSTFTILTLTQGKICITLYSQNAISPPKSNTLSNGVLIIPKCLQEMVLFSTLW